jgi:aminoglycoside 6'-N-acetyltransferase
MLPERTMIEQNAETSLPVKLRPASDADRFRIRAWLRDPNVQDWWGTAASMEAEINLAMSSTSALCRVIELDGKPVGYAQACDGAAWSGASADMPAGSWTVAIFISDAQRGHVVAAALMHLVEEVFATTLAIACCGVVPVRNEAAARAYEHARFRWRRICHDPMLGAAWLMVLERPRD